jgi:hypothetical protein
MSNTVDHWDEYQNPSETLYQKSQDKHYLQQQLLERYGETRPLQIADSTEDSAATAANRQVAS